MNFEEHPSKIHEEASQTEEPADRVYMHFDGIKETLPLRLNDYGDDGALREDQIQNLAKDFQLDINLARDLSVLVGYSLDIDSEVSLVRVTREQRGNKRGRQDEQFRKFFIEGNGDEVPVQPRDKRSVSDDRRISLIESCCYIWLDAGRKLTFTTRPDKPSSEQREGELIRFIQTVVGMVTKPMSQIPGETLRSDIELVRRRFRRRGALDPIGGT